MDHPAFVEQTEPAAVFSMLAGDTRIAILRTLWDSGGALTFTELREAVGVRDSGQFNYHLDKLLGHLVAKTDDGSYHLTEAGRQINGAIQAGSYTTSGEVDSITLERPCGPCGGTRTFTYESERVTAVCESCTLRASFPVPPSAFGGHDREEMPAVAQRYLRVLFARLQMGFCVYCDGRVEGAVKPASETDSWDDTDNPDGTDVDPSTVPIIQFECHQCGAAPTGSLALSLLDHPAVVSFHFEHGIDIRDRPVWDFMALTGDDSAIRSRDPFRASHTFSAKGDQLTVTVDEDGHVIEVQAGQP